jgi:serine/threonine protein kinase
MAYQDPLIGRQLGDYRVISLLGRGGMARVYRGYDERLERYSAVKVIDAALVTGENQAEYRARFLREARAIARLNHPSIVGVYQFGEVDQLYYMAMVFIEGRDLGQILRADGGVSLTNAQILRIVHDIAGALDYAHAGGVIHRDVKPSNIMVTREGAAILTDFGLALSVPEGSIGTTFGSAHYIAPEQALSSANAVPQSDLYSLGIVLYQLLTGRVPFDDPSAMSVALKHLSEPPPPPRNYNPNLSEAVQRVLMRVLEKEPATRYRSGEEFARALEAAMGISTLNTAREYFGTAAPMLDTSTPPATSSTLLFPPEDLTPTGQRPPGAPDRLSPQIKKLGSRITPPEPDPEDTARGLAVPPVNPLANPPSKPSRATAPLSSLSQPAAPPARPSGVWAVLRRDRRSIGALAAITLALAAFLAFTIVRGNTGGDTPDDAVTPAMLTGAAVAMTTDEASPAAATDEASQTPTRRPTRTPLRTPTAETTPEAAQRTAVSEPLATNTPRPTRTPARTATPSQTPGTRPTARAATDDERPHVTLRYDADSLLLINTSARSVNVSGLVFRQVGGSVTLTYLASQWEGPLRSLAPNSCLQIWRIDRVSFLPEPDDCLTRFWRGVGQLRWFWIGSDPAVSFNVEDGDGVVLANCPITASLTDPVECVVPLD